VLRSHQPRFALDGILKCWRPWSFALRTPQGDKVTVEEPESVLVFRGFAPRAAGLGRTWSNSRNAADRPVA